MFKIGSRGAEVKIIQAALYEDWGMNGTLAGTSRKADGSWDGIYGEGTAQVVKTFQERNGLPATGEVDDRTWEFLLGEGTWEVPVSPTAPISPIYKEPEIMPPVTTAPISTAIAKAAGGINWGLVAILGAAIIVGTITIAKFAKT